MWGALQGTLFLRCHNTVLVTSQRGSCDITILSLWHHNMVLVTSQHCPSELKHCPSDIATMSSWQHNSPCDVTALFLWCHNAVLVPSMTQSLWCHSTDCEITKIIVTVSAEVRGKYLKVAGASKDQLRNNCWLCLAGRWNLQWEPTQTAFQKRIPSPKERRS